ncbi:MAG TPA: hypothetical protein VFR41_08530, partial [Acidimicrobiia bacterium]|nr:hypothetical protein [Acidimicrobiia bacterium]
FSARSDRIINFALCIVGSNCVGTGAIALTARIEYHDWDPALRTDVPNPTVSILSWTRNAQ